MKKRFKSLLIALSLFVIGVGGTGPSTSRFTDIRKLEAGGTGLNGWSSDFNSGASGTVTTSGSMIVIDVTAAGTADWHSKFCKYGTSVVGGNIYTLTFVMYSTTAIKANYIVNNAAAGWSPYTGSWNMPITTSRASYVLDYSPAVSSSNVELLFQFGGAWAENTAGAFTIYIEKIILETKTPTVAFSEDFTSGISGWETRWWGDSTGSIANPSSNLVQTITNYGNTERNAVQLYKNTGITLTSGSVYRIDMDISVLATQNFETCFEDLSLNWMVRAGYHEGTWTTSTTNYSYLFTASNTISELFLHFQFGQIGTTNTLTIDNVKIYSYPSTFDETRVGYYASEFATVLADYDTCTASEETGYLAVPTLKATYFDKLIDAANLSTSDVTDYAYSTGEGSGPKTENAVHADIKFAAMVAMYNANNGSNPDIYLAHHVNPTSTNNNLLPLLSLLGLGLACSFFFFLKQKQNHIQ